MFVLLIKKSGMFTMCGNTHFGASKERKKKHITTQQMSITTKIKIGPDSEYDAFEYEDAALKDTER